MKLLITGFSGFVARHFLEYINMLGIQYDVVGIDVNPPKFDYRTKKKEGCSVDFLSCNLLDANRLNKIICEFEPEYVLHLASFSSVAYSWKEPVESFNNNLNIFLNLLTAVRQMKKHCRILSVGSSEEYGNVNSDSAPLVEDMELNPVSPYAVARVSQEMMAKVFSNSFGMDIVLTRSFNHIGPYQDNRFVVPSFIERILNVKEAGKKKGNIEVGNIELIRDFVDVRDVVRAYYLLLTEGKNGEIYNICSGKGINLKTIIDIVSDNLEIEISPIINPDFIRPSDNNVVIGSYDKIYNQYGWKPQIDIRDTIMDMIKQTESVMKEYK